MGMVMEVILDSIPSRSEINSENVIITVVLYAFFRIFPVVLMKKIFLIVSISGIT